MAKNSLAHEIMTDRVREYMIQCLAKGYKPKEATDFTINEFQMDWNLSTETKGDIEKLKAVRDYLYNRAKDFLYESAQDEIAVARKQWLLDIESSSRDANKSFRIAEYSRIKDLCMKAGEYRTATLALKMIAMEKGELSLGFNVKGSVQHTHRKVETETDINARIKEILNSSGAGDRERDLIIASLSKN